MRIIGLSNAYVPAKNAGAQTTLHDLLRPLAHAGHDVRVVTTSMPDVEPYRHEGIAVDTRAGLRGLLDGADVLVAQLAALPLVHTACREAGVPLVHLVHTNDEKTRKLMSYEADLTVFCANWLRDEFLRSFPVREHMVIHPPVDPARYRTEPGRMVTLINTSLLKGADIFYQLAGSMPGQQFLAVRGHHERQIVQSLPNVVHMSNTSDVRSVYGRTKVLLMPSRHETFGRVGVEALASGIPVVASPTGGVVEALGECASYVVDRDPRSWRMTLTRILEDPEVYDRCSFRSRQRSKELWQQTRVEELCWIDALRRLAAKRGRERDS